MYKLLFTRGLVVSVLTLTVSVQCLDGQQGISKQNITPEALKMFLRSYLNPRRASPDKSTRITVVSVATKSVATEEQIVYVSGQGWCGSGGCMLLVLERSGASFKILGDMSIVQLPVRILPSMEHGHPDIGVNVRGREVGSEYEAKLSFDGTAYPTDPTLPPARRIPAGRGKQIITTTESSVSLYD